MSNGWWQAQPTASQYKCDLFPPDYDGVNEGDTAQTNCTKQNADQVNWVWHLGKPECRDSGSYNDTKPHLTTDVNTRCTCFIFGDDFNCQSSLGGWWNVKSGSMTLQADSPLFYGTAYWENDGSGWYLTNNNCLFNCNPVTPNDTPTNFPAWETTGCSAPSNNSNQARWKWNGATQLWQLDYGTATWNYGNTTWNLVCNNCLPNCNPVQPLSFPTWNANNNSWNPVTTPCVSTIGGYCFGGAWVYPDSEYGYTDWEQAASPCIPLQPSSKGTTDGEIQYTTCPNTNHAVLGSNTHAVLNYGKTKTNDLLVVVEVINPAPSDEVRIYFNSTCYAYFTFATVEDWGYTLPPPYPPIYPVHGPFYPDDRGEEGSIGIYDGSQRIGHKSWYAMAFTNASYWVALWIRKNEDESQQVATALIGSNSRMGGRGPGGITDVASAYVAVSQADIGIGSGQITEDRTLIDRVSVNEASRSWLNSLGTPTTLTPDDCSYSKNANPTYADYFGSCWSAGFDNINCQDGIPPSEITVQISGVHSGQNSDDTQPFYSDPPCPSCSSINGTYVLTRNDVCVDVSCEGSQYVYYGSCSCGPFTIGLELFSNYLGEEGHGNYGIYFSILPCIPPLWQCVGGGIGTNGEYQPIAATGTNGRLDCLGNDLIGATVPLTGFSWGTWGWQQPNECFEGSISITGVSYA